MTHTTSDYAALIRKQGFRLTPQRQLILDAICESGGHVTPEEIYERVQAVSPAVNRATVYRNLDFLCDIRLVVAANIGRHMYYEIAGKQPHHHLICRRCNTVTQIDHTAIRDFFELVETAHDFKVDMDHLTLFGLCTQCRSTGATRGSNSST
jgi:Fe2+ or Zn2+ uptake regulation protein